MMSPEEKVAALADELDSINDTGLKGWATECVKKFPDYFFVIAASSSGKHHPYWSLGEGGLLRHTKAVVAWAAEIAPTYEVDDYTLDKIKVAGLLHDSFKYGLDNSIDKRYHELHPFLPRVALSRVKYIKDHVDRVASDLKSEIFTICESHMGSTASSKWSLLPYVKIDTRPKQILHLADYTVSRKTFIFEPFKGTNTSILENRENYTQQLISDKEILAMLFSEIILVYGVDYIKTFIEGKGEEYFLNSARSKSSMHEVKELIERYVRGLK